jgi:pimeloyl-ACP methyl ester carboxylesterase
MKYFRLPGELGLLRYHDMPGQGVPLLCIHGLGCAASCDFPRLAADPALAGRRLLLVDLLGSGFSDRPSEFAYDVTAHAQTLYDLLQGLDIGRVDLFGHSMGGAIAIELAVRLGARLRHLVLAEPNLDAGGGVFSREVAASSEADFVAQGLGRMVAGGAPIWVGSLAISLPQALHREAVSLVAGGSPAWREQLLGLQGPRTVVFGQHSLPDPDVKRLAAAGIHTAVVADAGHSMAWENPTGLAQAIAAALARDTCH